MSDDVPTFPTRFLGYDRAAVDHELCELLTALAHARDDRDRAVARALSLEHGDPAQASASVRWLIETAEQDALRIHAEAKQAAAEHVERAEALLRHRVELIEQAQHEADGCRARAAEEARTIVQDALDQANGMLCGLRESAAALNEMFAGGALAHRMPPPRQAQESLPQPVPRQEVGAHAEPQPLPHREVGAQPVAREEMGAHTEPMPATGGQRQN